MKQEKNFSKIDKLQKIVLQKIEDHDYRGLCYLSPRLGKTKICIDLIKKMKPNKILWVTEFTDLIEKDLPKEFKKWNLSTENVIFTTYNSFNKYTGEYDLIILDEYHNITKNNSANLLNGLILSNALIGLTGTHPRSEEKQNILKSLNLKIICKMSIKKASKKGLISNYEILPLKVKRLTKKDFAILKRVNNTYLSNPNKENAIKRNSAYSKLDSKFNKVVKLKNDLLKQKSKVLIICSSIEHANKLGNAYHSKIKKKDRQKLIEDYNNDKIDYVSIVNSGGTGTTYLGTTDVIIYKFNNNNNGRLTQKLSRALINDGIKPFIWCVYYDDELEKKWLQNTLQDLK